MKVLLHSDMQKAIEKSGVGRALDHQIMALRRAGVDYTLDPKDHYDLVHINTIFPQSYLFADLALKRGKTVVYHAHSTEEDFRDSFVLSNAIAPAFKKWLKTCYSKSDLVLTPTAYSKGLLEAYDLTSPIEVVSNGIDLDYWQTCPEERKVFRAQYQLGEKDKVIISVGHYIKRKGILDFVELAKRLPHYHFIWYGYTDPILVPEEIRIALEISLPNLTFAGYVDRDALRVAYGACDLYLFPTYEETEGIVLLEALASKAKVLIRDIPIYEKAFTDGVNVYKARDLDGFEDRICSILEGKVPTLVDEGYRLAQSRSIDQVGQRLKACYRMAMTYHDQYLNHYQVS